MFIFLSIASSFLVITSSFRNIRHNPGLLHVITLGVIVAQIIAAFVEYGFLGGIGVLVLASVIEAVVATIAFVICTSETLNKIKYVIEKAKKIFLYTILLVIGRLAFVITSQVIQSNYVSPSTSAPAYRAAKQPVDSPIFSELKLLNLAMLHHQLAHPILEQQNSQ